jgi:hypothetical protein
MHTQKVLLASISIRLGFPMPFFSENGQPSETLFNDRQLSSLIELQSGRAENIVAEYGRDVLLATPTEDIVELAYDVCHLEVPVLLEDKAYQADPREIIREVQDYGRTVRVPGFEYRITIPFEGHLGLFRHSSPISVGDAPRAKANEDGITITASGYNLTREDLEAHIKKTLNLIEWISSSTPVGRELVLHLHQFRRHSLDVRHIIVKNGLLAAIIPFDGNTGPVLFGDGAKVRCRGSPADAVADIEQSGLVTGHVSDLLIRTPSTRLISLWPVKLLWPSSHFMVTYRACVAMRTAFLVTDETLRDIQRSSPHSYVVEFSNGKGERIDVAHRSAVRLQD